MEENMLSIKTNAKLENVSVVRLAMSNFISQTKLDVQDVLNLKTAISEAVTNICEHAYPNKKDGKILVNGYIFPNMIKIEIIDYGIGIENIELAMEAEYSSKSEEEHAGLGFTIMESLTDELLVDSIINTGTTITMIKNINN